MKKKVLKITVYTYIAIMLIATLLNVLTSPSYPWALYPGFGLLIIGLGIYFSLYWNHKLASISLMSAIFILVLILNLVNSPDTLWVQHIAFFLIWWPLIAFLREKAKSLLFSILGAVAIIAFAYYEYTVYTPGVTMWYLYVVVPALWWPISILLQGKWSFGQIVKTVVITNIIYMAVINIVFLAYDLY